MLLIHQLSMDLRLHLMCFDFCGLIDDHCSADDAFYFLPFYKLIFRTQFQNYICEEIVNISSWCTGYFLEGI